MTLQGYSFFLACISEISRQPRRPGWLAKQRLALVAS